MYSRLVILAVVLVGKVFGLLGLSHTTPYTEADFAGLTGDTNAGKAVFHMASCTGCHSPNPMEPLGLSDLSGGKVISGPFGTVTVPNITNHTEHGIGNWSVADFANAVAKGIRPDGRHLLPLHPSPAYFKATKQDLANLDAYVRSLPVSDNAPALNDLSFPYSANLYVRVWKGLKFDNDFTRDLNDPTLKRGQYLVEALGGCADCHTPKGWFGRLNKDKWMTGGQTVETGGDENLVARDAIPQHLRWTPEQLGTYLQTGFSPSFVEARGAMRAVAMNLSHLPREDLLAIALYLQAIGQDDGQDS